MTNKIFPGRPMPDVELPMVGKEGLQLLTKRPAGDYKLLVVYRGYHCPACKKQLESITQQLDELASRNVEIFALSCDDEDRANKTVEEWQVDGLPLAYGLPVAEAFGWGLFISASISEKEPRQFSEPGIFLLDKESKVHALWIQSVPFARPLMSDILKAIDFIEEKDYPPRGTVQHI